MTTFGARGADGPHVAQAGARHDGGGAHPGGPVHANRTDGEHERAAQPATLLRVGSPLARRVKGLGNVTLDVRVEATGRRGRPLSSVPAGAPVELRFTVPAAAGVPRLTAQRVERSLLAAAQADRGTGAGGHGGHQTASAAPTRSVPLDRGELFLVDRRDGEILVPSGEAAGSGSTAQPGRAMTERLMPGGALAWATKVTAGASDIASDRRGRFLLATYRAAGRIEIVDLLRRGAPSRVALGGRVGVVVFEPSGRRAWIADDAGGRVSVVDLASSRVVASIVADGGAQALAFTGNGRSALLAGRDGRARLVDVRTRRVLATLALPAAATAAAFAPGAKSFVVAHEDGRISVLRMRGPGRLARGPVLAVGSAAAGTRTLGVAPDGRTAVALNAAANSMTLVDVAAGRRVASVATGKGPAELAFLDHFALARNARSADVTWVDLDQPSRSNNVPVGRANGDGLYVKGDTAFVPSAQDRRVYTLHTMMGRPMVMGEVPNAFAADRVVASSGRLERIEPGVFLQRTMIAAPGTYRIALSVGGRRTAFEVPVSGGHHGAQAMPDRPQMRARPGEAVDVRFRVRGARPDDAQALAYGEANGVTRQLRAPAARAGDGSYRARLRFADPGVYRVVLLSEQAGLRPDKSVQITIAGSAGGDR